MLTCEPCRHVVSYISYGVLSQCFLCSIKSFTMYLSYVLIALLSICACVASRGPIVIPWSHDTYGPDGPWQAVELSLGGSKLSLYPGGDNVSYVFTAEFCKNGPSNCTARQAGLYDEGTSSSKDSSGSIKNGSVGQWGSDQTMNLTSDGTFLFDDFSFISEESLHQDIQAKHIPVWAVDNQNSTLPSGAPYPQRVAGLALGGIESFIANGTQNISVPTFSSSLQQNYGLPSSSWALHYGSANHNIPGSLIIGGYDANRVLGTVLSSPLQPTSGLPLVQLTGIRVNSNSSDADSKASRNVLQDTLDTSPLSVFLQPSIPYLSQPAPVCASIATLLPLTFQQHLGLYTWNTVDPAYGTLISSATELNFHFSNSKLMLRVPFALLSLTLEPPLVDTPTPYFPCAPTTDPSRYALGRAFLQAAYLIVDMDRGRTFLAQAPGPGLNRTPSVQELGPDDAPEASASSADFDATWSGAQASGAAGANVPAAAASSGSPSSGSASGAQVPVGALVGVAVSVTAVAALLAFLVVFKLRARRRAQRQEQAAKPAEIMSSDSGSLRKAGFAIGQIAELDEVHIAELNEVHVTEADGVARSELPAGSRYSRPGTGTST